MSGIPPIPKIPEEIKYAIEKGTLAVFIGAGVSRLVGCQGWEVLAKNLVTVCHETEVINFKEKDTLLQIQDHKKIITICYHLLKNSDLQEIFYNEMCISLNEDGQIATPNIYNDLYKLRGLFITTNADTHFDKLFLKQNIRYREVDFQKDILDSTNLYHIHGSILDRDSLIFTVSAYMKRYTNMTFRRFLERIFNEYTVLFLGYGVSEFEILDFIMRDNDKKTRITPKHFMLSPFYKGEDNILKYEQEYYNDLDINILGFEKDIKGYNQLAEVIKDWNQEINQVTGFIHSAAKLIDEAIV